MAAMAAMAAMATSFEFGETVWRQSSAQVFKCQSSAQMSFGIGTSRVDFFGPFSYFSVISEGSNVTAFSFIFVEYTKNIYGWSDSAPPGARMWIAIVTVPLWNAIVVACEAIRRASSL